ncbi:MAG: glutathione peroxidase-family protein [Saprospiraceae bacterium]
MKLQTQIVNGKNEHPIYRYLKETVGPKLLKIIKWNFTEFLIGPDGEPVKRYAPTTLPKAIEKNIVALLGEVNPFLVLFFVLKIYIRYLPFFRYK